MLKIGMDPMPPVVKQIARNIRREAWDKGGKSSKNQCTFASDRLVEKLKEKNISACILIADFKCDKCMPIRHNAVLIEHLGQKYVLDVTADQFNVYMTGVQFGAIVWCSLERVKEYYINRSVE